MLLNMPQRLEIGLW